MSGIFSKSARPKRPGAYFNWAAAQPPAVQPAIGSVVAVGFTHVWGPENTTVSVASLQDWLAVYGGNPNSPSSGYKAVKQAFIGEGHSNRGGAGRVIAYRMVASGGAKAAKTLQNTTPVNALTLTARYKGTRGNDLKVTVQVNASDATKDDLIILDGSLVLETYTYAGVDIAALVAAINASSSWVTAALLQDGVRLAYVSSSALTGGNDGSTLVSGDYTAAFDAFDSGPRFGVLCFENLTDAGITASLKTWAVNLNQKGKRFFTVLGGASDETAATAITAAGLLNDPDFLRVGMGHVEDTNFLDGSGNPASLSSAQLAPRIAGVLAARNEERSLTFAHLGGLTLKNGATEADILKAFDGGVIVLATDSHPLAPVRIERGMTTFTTTSDPLRPQKVWGSTKAVAVMHGLETEMTSWAEQTIVGETTVDDETRAAVAGEAARRLTVREQRRVIQSGWTVAVDVDPPATDEDDFIQFVLGVKFGRSTEQVYFTGRIG